MILAFGDVHSPDYLPLLDRALKGLRSEPELVLLAGDMVRRNKVDEMPRVIRLVRRHTDAPILGVFGNEEYEESEELYIEQNPEVRWLRDEGAILSIGNVKIGVFGTRGSLQEPTWWQSQNIPGIRKRYRERISRTREGLRALRVKVDVLILLSHYSVGFRCVVGEPERIWKFMGHPEMERVALETGVDIAIHGHAHRARVLEAEVQGMRILNVALPARGDVTLLKPRPRGGTLFSFG